MMSVEKSHSAEPEDPGKPARVPADHLREAAGESLGLMLFLVISRATDFKLVGKVLSEHRSYLRQLEDSDKLFAAGPLLSPDGELFEGDGLLVYRAQSVVEARQIADQDPMHSSGARSYQLAPWILNDGSLNLRVVLSRQLREVR